MEGRLGTLTWMAAVAITLIGLVLGGEFTIWSRMLDQQKELGAVVVRLTQQGDVLDAHTAKLNELTTRMNDVTARVDVLTTRVDVLSGRVDDLTGKINDLTGKVGDLAAKSSEQSGKLDAILAKLH